MLPIKYLDVLPRPGRSIWEQEMKIDRGLLFGLFLFHPAATRFYHVFRQALSCSFGRFLNCFFVRWAIHPNVKYNSLVCFVVEFSLAGSAGFAAHLKHQLSFDFIRYYIISVPAVHSVRYLYE